MFAVVTLILPAAVWWFLSRIEVIDAEWALIAFGVTVVLLDYGIYGIGGWRAEGRDGFVKDVFDTYSKWAGGWFGVFILAGLGCPIGELGADAVKAVRARARAS